MKTMERFARRNSFSGAADNAETLGNQQGMISTLLLLGLFDDPEAGRKLSSFQHEVSVNSASWTGIEARLKARDGVEDEVAASLRAIRIKMADLGLTNIERAKLDALINAAENLIASPEPEWRAVVQILSSPAVQNFIALANIVLFLFQGLGII